MKKKEKNPEEESEILKEVADEIDSALKDQKGIVSHQRRLAFCLSLGTVAILEDYFKKRGILKPGIKINHLWLKKSIKNIKEILADKITSPIENLKELDSILEKASSLEKERENLAYGKLVSEKSLQDKINLFLKLKEEIGNV